jgi:AMP-binding enzyme
LIHSIRFIHSRDIGPAAVSPCIVLVQHVHLFYTQFVQVHVLYVVDFQEIIATAFVLLREQDQALMYSSKIKSIAGLVDAAANRAPSRMALLSPFQGHQFTYEELSKTTSALAGFLTMYGFETKDILVSDLPNTSENLLVQLACNRLGVAYATAKDAQGMSKFTRVKGAICTDSKGFLADTSLPLPVLEADFLSALINEGGLDSYGYEVADAGGDNPHAFYNSTSAFTNGEALQLAEKAAFQLAVHDQDVVCVAITLCHAFGMGSAVASALMMGATIVLPAVGGIRGCGVPADRAAATLEVLKNQKCTLMFADTHTLKAMPEPPLDLVLRGGVCKVGSGSDFLEEFRSYGGAKLMTMGKKQG